MKASDGTPVSAWLPYRELSHCIVRSATMNVSASMTVEKAAFSSPTMVSGLTVARARGASATNCVRVTPSARRKRNCARETFAVGLKSANRQSNIGPVAPSAK